MLLCMTLSTAQIHALVDQVRRVLRPGGPFIYTVRHTGDAHYGQGIAHGDDIYEHGGFAVHFFSRTLVDDLAAGWTLQEVHPFDEGDLPRRLCGSPRPRQRHNARPVLPDHTLPHGTRARSAALTPVIRKP
jgi:SAM-dependent methyltransferase